MKKFFIKLSIIILFVVPVYSFAQNQNPLPTPPWQTDAGTDVGSSVDAGTPDLGPYYKIGGGDWGAAPSGDTETYYQGIRTCSAPKFKGEFGLFVHNVVCVIELYIIPIFLLIGFVIFLWSGSQFVRHAANEEARSEYKNALIWGVIIIFVMLSFWGIILLFRTTVGI